MRSISKYQNESIHRKLTVILVVMVLILLIFGVGFVVKLLDLTTPRAIRNSKSSNPETLKTITVTGTPVCLKLKTDAESPAKNCELGIRTDKGEHYAVSIRSRAEFLSNLGSSGIEIKGKFIPADSDERYDIKGTILYNE